MVSRQPVGSALRAALACSYGSGAYALSNSRCVTSSTTVINGVLAIHADQSAMGEVALIACTLVSTKTLAMSSFISLE